MFFPYASSVYASLYASATSICPKESVSAVIQITSNGNQTSGEDLNITVDKPSESIVLHGSFGETSVLAMNETGKDGCFPCSTTPADSAAQNAGDIREESVAKVADLVCKRVPDRKLHVVKRPFKRQVTRMQLSSNIIFSAAFGRKKKKHGRSKRQSSGKQDRNPALSDLGPSTSETPKTVSNDFSGYSEIKVNSFSNEENKCSMNVAGDGNMVGVYQELRNRVSQHKAVLSNDKQSERSTSILKFPSSVESRLSNYNSKNHVENGLMSMLTRGLEETTVAQWDSFEHPSELVDSRSTESVSIGYVGDDWDEEYDRGKRKKIRNNQITFGGPNPFQEVAIKKSKLKKRKLDRSSSANQPFRI